MEQTKLNEAVSLGNIFNEGLGDAIKAGVKAAGANIKATNQVNKQNKEADKAAALKNAQDNLGAVKLVIDKLQPIANEQKPFDANTITELIDSVNKLNLDNGIKKQINQLLNQQTQALNDAAAKQEKPEAEKPQGGDNATKTEDTAQPEQKGNAANILDGDKNTISVQLQNIAKDLGKSVDDIIAYIKTL